MAVDDDNIKVIHIHTHEIIAGISTSSINPEKGIYMLNENILVAEQVDNNLLFIDLKL